MDFRWVAFITLWTLLSGPIFALPRVASTTVRTEAAGKVVKQSEAHGPARR
jgi:hypothetical protein